MRIPLISPHMGDCVRYAALCLDALLIVRIVLASCAHFRTRGHQFRVFIALIYKYIHRGQLSTP